MTKFSKELIAEFKDLYKKRGGEEISDGQADLMLDQLAGFYSLLWKIDQRQVKLQQRLKTEPKGFPVEGNCQCKLCNAHIDSSNGWYDKYGHKCTFCQKALDDGVIPSFIFINDNSFFRMWQLKSYFDLRYQTVKKMMREGKVTAKEIMNDENKVHEHVFLKKENPMFSRRYNSIRKSWNRNRAKVFKARQIEIKKKQSNN